MTERDWRKMPWTLTHRTLPKAASDLRRVATQLTHRHAHVEFQGPVRLGPGFHLDIPDEGTLVIGPAVDLRRGFVCEISGTGRVVIGGGSVFTSHSLIQCSTSIEIGLRCLFGQATLIVDGNHKFRDLTKPMLEQGYDFRPIRIANDVTVMTKSTVFADIGERSVIGSNSVVVRPIPAYCVAVGAPARVVDYFGPPELRPPELDARG